MKTNGILPISRMLIVFLFSSLFFKQTFSQPDYTFKNPTLESGTNLAVGSVYLFKNVKPGVDARIVVNSVSGGITLDAIDEAWTGFDEAFQPFIKVTPASNGYVEFEIKFYITNTNTLMVQTKVPMTAIDVDGIKYASGDLLEQDQFQLKSGYVNFDMTKPQLNMALPSGWVVGKNKSGISYPGIDTAQKDVMFTVVNAGIDKIIVRIGASNTSTVTEVRYRSVYFKEFKYPNALLPVPSLISFKGSASDLKVNLDFQLSVPEEIASVLIERADGNLQFQNLSSVDINHSVSNYQYSDVLLNGQSYYRLKIITVTGAVAYSNILKFTSDRKGKETLRIFPTVVNDRATIQFQTPEAGSGVLQVVDYNGRVVSTQKLPLQKGTNSIVWDEIGNVPRGNYIAVVKWNDQTFQQKIMKQ
jgi:hypothetical protein